MIMKKKMALLHKREPIFKINLQESHFDSLIFLSVRMKGYDGFIRLVKISFTEP